MLFAIIPPTFAAAFIKQSGLISSIVFFVDLKENKSVSSLVDATTSVKLFELFNFLMREEPTSPPLPNTSTLISHLYKFHSKKISKLILEKKRFDMKYNPCMEENWEINLKVNIEKFLINLQDNENFYIFNPVMLGNTKHGRNLGLGFSCYALKCFHMLGLWDNLDKKEKDSWVEYINSFQKNINHLPEGSFVDKEVENFYNSLNSKLAIKNILKNLLNVVSNKKRPTNRQKYLETIRAESKQAIATLNEVGYVNNKKYLEFPRTEVEINTFLDDLNWDTPWTTGAQFSALCVFSATQLEERERDKNIKYLYSYLDNVVNEKSGFYHINEGIKDRELINGAMKVITGLDWINKPIHYPEKLIDFCLNSDPSPEGCDIVDTVYVLFKCFNQSDYKKDEINSYFNNVKTIISQHFDSKHKSFSYYRDKSQDFYYGLKITEGQNEPDIHGTTLLLWALSMIYSFQGNKDYKIIKP